MNRQQRRKQKVKEKIPTYNMSKFQLEALKTLAKTQGLGDGIILGMILTTNVLMEEHEFSNKDIVDFIKAVTEKIDKTAEGGFNLERLTKEFKDNTGYDIAMDGEVLRVDRRENE